MALDNRFDDREPEATASGGFRVMYQASGSQYLSGIDSQGHLLNTNAVVASGTSPAIVLQ